MKENELRKTSRGFYEIGKSFNDLGKYVWNPENNYAFIDNHNLYLSLKRQGWTLNYRKFRQYLYDRFNVTHAYLFLGYVEDHQYLYKKFKRDGFKLIFKPAIRFKNGLVKGNVDTDIVLHAVTKCNKYDKAIIVTGDGDFYCLVEYLLRNGKLERLIIPDKCSFSSLFRKFKKEMVFMNNLRERLGFV